MRGRITGKDTSSEPVHRATMDITDDFSTVPFDVNGDGNIDFITGGWFEKTLRWYENSGDPKKHWPSHDIEKTTNIETTYGWDIDGDGLDGIVAQHP